MNRINTVNCNGMYRSGSTLCFILLKELAKRESLHLTIVKKHHTLFAGRNVLNLYTYRDLRDVLRSFCIKYGRRLSGIRIDGRDYHAFLDHVIGFDRTIKSNQKDNKLILRYEDGVLEALVSSVFERLGIDDSRRDYYRERFHLEEVRSRLPRSGHEEDTQLHCNHIHDGATGKWRRFFSGEEKARLDNHESLQLWLEQNSYAVGDVDEKTVM